MQTPSSPVVGRGPEQPSPVNEASPVPAVPNAVRDHWGQAGEVATASAGLGAELQRDLEARRLGDQASDSRLRQQAAIVRVGLEALASHDLDGTLDLLVREAATALGVDFCSVQELGPDRATFTVRADHGGPPSLDGSAPLCILGKGQATYTLHSAAPVVSTDLHAERRFNVPATVLAYGARSGMSVILHGKQQPWGVVGAHAKTVRTFTEQDTIFLQAIANLMALAIERDRVETVLRLRTRQQAAVVRLGSEALAGRELEGTLDLLVREAGATLRADFCCVLELGDDRSSFQLRASFGWRAGSAGAAALCEGSDSQARYTLLAGTSVASDDLRKEARFAVHPLVLQEGAVSSMCVILHGKHKVWGVLAAHTKTQRKFTEEDVNFLQAIANVMALAMERERVEVALRNRNRQQAAVAMLGRRALVGPHLDDLFADAAREVASTLQVELCEILQRSPDGKTLLLRAGVGWQPGLVGTARVSSLPTSQGGFTQDADGPVLVADLREETRFEVSPILRDQGVVSGIGVVVPTGTGSFGVLGAHTLRRRAFTQDDSNFLQSVANLLAGAIERHRVEGELRRHRSDLEGLVQERTALLAASNRELEAFSYTISHDLRAPLRSINGLSKILQRRHGDTLPEEANAMLVQMSGETVRMGKLIDSILALSRLGSVQVLHVAVDVSAMATVALQAFQANEPGRDVVWTVEPGLNAVGDEALLRVAVENLVGNAWKFTGRTAGARIVVAGEPAGFRVEDNGAGFDMAHARELFQPFHRLHPAEQFEGTGIGLATVNRIVARHAGRVWAQASPGKGATFHVALPPMPVPMASAPLQDQARGPFHPGPVKPTASDSLP